MQSFPHTFRHVCTLIMYHYSVVYYGLFIAHGPYLVQASGEAEMLAHIRQVKDLELKLKAKGDEERAVVDEWRAREEGLRAEVDQLVCRVEDFKRKVEEKELEHRKGQAELDEARAEVRRW